MGARTGIELLDSTPANAGAGHVTIDPSEPASGGVSGVSGAPGAGAPGAGAPTVAGAGGLSQCESVTVSIDELRPAITIMVDQSRSMRSGFPTRTSPNTRWSLVGQALFEGVVKTFEARVRFGIAFFTGRARPGMGGRRGRSAALSSEQ